MPILLEDYRKISVERKGIEEKDFFTSQQVRYVSDKTVRVLTDKTARVRHRARMEQLTRI